MEGEHAGLLRIFPNGSALSRLVARRHVPVERQALRAHQRMIHGVEERQGYRQHDDHAAHYF